ncbi:hypothetical protein M409DRAFT_66220 [Zasmidium cellare ATCC 36951]|uniref:DUF7820 domain-containing protein n=1 Tax=Zasmidium cellare ATCC 36951 TaxID=1080233 RepID=A0A6A6CNY3_ZASCE|nr:uncharacterized protein M409DRAFT_66220 [Zasmidium cellare ATCC 36951]KAF2167186.1 hypothetical protein M409DRAFT_66220 [Zasmidium cellare ATCC 36951]
MDRRSYLDGDATPTHEHTNVFGDEFEVDDFDGVADGFRPNVDREEDAQSRQDDVTDYPVPTTVSAHYATSPVTPTSPNGPSRNSTRKSRGYLNPFASPDDEDSSHERQQSLEFEPDSLIRRSTSSASSHVYAQTNSPRFGAGPSHPYGAYQQGTVARTLSVGTTSTVRPGPRQSYSQSRPQHPYALYPQGVDDDLEDDDDDTVQMRQNPVPVGFPGLGQNYTRRLGPDGEDQDIIGEDGHTEQLPPYSRYPEDGPEKMPLLPTALHSRAPVAGTDPGMPLMHTALQPSPTPQPTQSMTDESALERHASRASTAHLISSSSSRTGSTFDEKKSWKEKSWKEKRKTRFCGIPLWWILLGVAVLTFIGAVLGGVIGGFVAGGNHARDKATVTVVTSLYDASLIASPTSGAPPTGTYALTLGQPEETQCACLPSQAQQVAWDCNLTPNAALGISVEIPGPGKPSGASVFYASNDTTIAYGAQLSSMNTPFAQFLTVQDNDDKSNGPAFYFQQFYDKVVVVPEEAIAVPSDSKKGKRGEYPPGFIVPEEWSHRKQVATPGDKPWFCVWNGTFLEGFIYIQQAASVSSSVASTTSAANSTSPPHTTPPPSTTTGFTPTPPTTPPPDIITTTITAPFTTATFTGAASDFNEWASARVDEAKRRFYGKELEDGYHAKEKRQNPNDAWSQMEVFPYIVKLEERRLPNNPQNPYCQQYQVLDSWGANWVADNDGNPIIVELNEQDPSYGAYESAGLASQTKRKRTIPGGCHCQWMSGETN